MLSTAMVLCLRVCRKSIRMICAETALLSAHTARLNTLHRKLLPLTDDGLLEFLLAAEMVGFPGFKFQNNGIVELLRLLSRGFADPLVELGVHYGSRVSPTEIPRTIGSC